MELKVTYDSLADATYIYLTEIGPGEAVRQLQAAPEIILDFDWEDRLIGIEVLNASRRLPDSILRGAERQA